jgi:hypothetical protein
MRNAIFADTNYAGSIDGGLREAEEDYTFRSVKRRSLRSPARWRASCAACVSSILMVGLAGAEEGAAAESCRDRLPWFCFCVVPGVLYSPPRCPRDL